MPDRPIAVVAGHPAEILKILDSEGIAHAEPAPDSLAAGIESGAFSGAVVHSEQAEALAASPVGDAIARQPPWSDFAFILLIERPCAAGLAEVILRLGNVTLVELPVDPAVLSNAVRGAIRTRTRQREAEEYLKQRREAERSLTGMKETLEKHVETRTQDLRAANERLLREIDERRAAEEKLRESEELHRHTLELTRQQVWTAAPDGTILSRSRWLSVMDDSPDLSETGKWIDAVHPSDRDSVLSAWKEALRSGKPATAELRIRMPEGDYRYFRARAAPHLNEAGEVVRWYGSTEDIHEHKLAELARAEAEERYRLAARATNDAIWDLDLVTQQIHWGEAAAETLGYPGPPLGTTDHEWWSERVHPDDRDHILRSFGEAGAKGKARVIATYRFRKADGDYLHVLDRGFLIRNAEGEAVRVVGAMMDLTERHRAEEAIRRMQAELIHVSRLSAMGTMASTLAHELNQPLTAVTNFVHGSRRLLEGVEDERAAEVRQALESAESAALRAGQIVRRLRELVAKGRSALHPEELPRLIEDAGAIAFIDAHLLCIDHEIAVEPDARWVEVDRVQIQQVLINLIRNAVQAMTDMKRREIRIHARAASPQMVEVSVADSGRGIPDEAREALFSPFNGIGEEGLGIGLSICRTIIEAHGGKIWAEDREGGGTIFRFTIRRHQMPAD